MDTNGKENRLAVFFSGLALLLAVFCLLSVCHYCYPVVEQRAKEVISGVDSGPVRQAFYTMAEGFESGEPVKETLTETVQVLFGKED